MTTTGIVITTPTTLTTTTVTTSTTSTTSKIECELIYTYIVI